MKVSVKIASSQLFSLLDQERHFNNNKNTTHGAATRHSLRSLGQWPNIRPTCHLVTQSFGQGGGYYMVINSERFLVCFLFNKYSFFQGSIKKA